MSDIYDDGPIIEQPEPRERADEQYVDEESEIDFDDERDDDQLPVDVVADIEAGTVLDDPEKLSDEDDDEE